MTHSAQRTITVCTPASAGDFGKCYTVLPTPKPDTTWKFLGASYEEADTA
jgi:hypothetical protein